ncbi:MAG TPA: hypothetical protein VEZ48_01650 [Sphingomonadaceae bacterium]|nr:hypothetical protein [Sphingomonadaceae bacterium]
MRYILDQAASAQCRDLMLYACAMFQPDDPCLRLPAERFWLEWFCDEDNATINGVGSRLLRMSSVRMGALVSADATGRRGNIHCFSEGANGPVMAQVFLLFDFDRELTVPKGSKTVFRLTHSELKHLNPLFRHLVMKLNPAWGSFMGTWQPAEFRQAISSLGK